MRTLTDPARHLLALVFPGRCPGCGGLGEPVCARCRACLRPPPPGPPPPGIDRWVAAFAYEGVGRELVARAKYQGRHAALPWLAARMAEAWVAAGGGVPDLLTWVPTAPARRRARGVDHARELGRGVARALGCRATAFLVRGPGPPQTNRSGGERRAGPVVGARRPAAGTILLVDDVATTGATLRACALALREVGADRVVALTAARTAAPT